MRTQESAARDAAADEGRGTPPELEHLLRSPVGGGAGETRPAAPRTLVGECVEDRHPSLQGRILVKWTDESGAERTEWAPTLMNLAVRRADRVLLIQACNWSEPVAVGVVDGFARRPESARATAAAISLRSDEAIRVQDANGHDVLEVFSSEAGPVVRLLQRDVNIELPGALRLKADSVEMTARSGPVSIQASDDVIVKGELVRLN